MANTQIWQVRTTLSQPQLPKDAPKPSMIGGRPVPEAEAETDPALARAREQVPPPSFVGGVVVT